MVAEPFAADGGADSRRAAWAAVGVHMDELSSLVLCLGLVGDVHSPLRGARELPREAGHPAMVPLRQLRCHDEPLRAGLVRVCENPVVVAAAADELGSRCPPLVCVGGQPSAAGWRLLDLLAAGGAQFRYHGDFDWGGIRIASAVRQRVGQSRWQPWRYDKDAYEAAATTMLARLAGRLPRLGGDPVPTPWDPGLAAVMARHDVRIEEELSLDTLLADLGQDCPGPCLWLYAQAARDAERLPNEPADLAEIKAVNEELDEISAW